MEEGVLESEIESLARRMEEHAAEIEQHLTHSQFELSPQQTRIKAQRALDLRVGAKLLRGFTPGTGSRERNAVLFTDAE